MRQLIKSKASIESEVEERLVESLGISRGDVGLLLSACEGTMGDEEDAIAIRAAK